MQKFTLPEENGHVVNYYVYGNSAGPTIVAFHGGPGSRVKPSHTDRFDLTTYQVVLFDQRGCGESTPMGDIEYNTTDEILHDAERIRVALGIEAWFVAGGSWGSTCALLYAIKYPERTKGLLLSAIFLSDTASRAWAMQDLGAPALLMPDVWQKRMEFFAEYGITVAEQNAKILNLLQTGDFETKKRIAAGVRNWEGNLFSPQSAISYVSPDDITERDVASTKISVWYELHDGFIPEGYVLNNIHIIAHIPAVIVHGRHDILCPLKYAYELAKGFQDCQLAIADASGHMLTSEGKTIQRMAYDQFLTEQRT